MAHHMYYLSYKFFLLLLGFMHHWTPMLLAEFWLLHLIHLFIKIAFPMWSRKLDSKQIKTILHVVEVAVALFLCSLAPVLNVIRSKYQLGRFPPIICYPSEEVIFYTLCFPLSVMLGIGTILAVNIFWMLHKVKRLYTICSLKLLRVKMNLNILLLKISFTWLN